MIGRRAELFASQNLRVRLVGGFGRDRLVVTFLPFNDPGHREERGFGELFFEKRQIDAIHFTPADNSWYQYPELPEAAALVRGVAAGYRKIVTYGSSMGGYGAIRFGALVGASDTLAISPQFSIDPTIAPFERRWPGEAASIDYTLERQLGSPFVGRAFVVYDPCSVDRAHVELYRRTTAVVDLPLVNAGHLATWILSDLGLLERLVLDVLGERLEPAGFIAEARRRRRESSWFFVALAEKSRHPRRRLTLARRACDMAPPEPVHLLTEATALAELGELAQAAAVLDRALRLVPGSVQLRCYLAHVLELAGDLEGALRLLRDLLAEHPGLAPACRAKADELAARRAGECAWRSGLRDRLAQAVPLGTGGRCRRGKLAGWFAGSRPGEVFDVVMIGDGLAQGWEAAFWQPFRVLNLGCDDDGVEPVLRRLGQLQRPIAARIALVTAGAANLRRGDRADDIAAGLHAIGRRLRVAMPRAWRIALELPPGSAADAAQERERERVNTALRREKLFATLATDRLAAWLAAGEDGMARTAYRMLTRSVFERLDAVLPPSAT
jgi:Tetratricopeptide repeat